MTWGTLKNIDSQPPPGWDIRPQAVLLKSSPRCSDAQMVLETRARHGYCVPSEQSLRFLCRLPPSVRRGIWTCPSPKFGKRPEEGMSADSSSDAEASRGWYWWLWISLESCSPLLKITSLQSLPLLENHLPRARGLHPGWQPAESLREHEEVARGVSRAWACNVVSLKSHIFLPFAQFSWLKGSPSS